MSKLFVGVTRQAKRELFHNIGTPTEDTYGHLYAYVIGPFRTRAGAIFMRDHGQGNPHCQCVADAEKLARL